MTTRSKTHYAKLVAAWICLWMLGVAMASVWG